MKRKSELAIALDDMFCEDDKRRLNAIKMLDLVANNLGPQRTRDQLIPFLNQFNDEDPPILLALLQEIDKIRSYLGGPEYEKLLLNPLINFCSSDQLQVAEASVKIIQSILSKVPSEYVDVIKKLAKQQMNVAKNSAALLIISGIEKLPHLEPTFIQIFKMMIFSEKASVRIIACKHLENLHKKIKNKEEIMKILQIVYNDSQDLPKLLTIDTLISMYSFNSNFVMSKLKLLVGYGKWRFDLKLCECAPNLAQKINKTHFRLILQPAFTAMMSSDDLETKAMSCFALQAVAKNLTPEENLTKLFPILQTLSSNKAIQVKASFSKNIVCLFPYFSADTVKQKLLPITFTLLKQNKLQISTGIIENFNTLAKQLKSSEKVQQYILKPLITQLNYDDWRLRVQMLTLLGKLAVQQNFVAPTMIDLLINSCLDRVEAIRTSAIKIVINIINKNTDDWVKLNIVPKLGKISNNSNYLIRQKILIIIDETAIVVGRSVLSEYRTIMKSMLSDKIPNIRMIGMKIASSKPNLVDKNIEIQLSKLKEDTDLEIRQAAKLIKI